MKECLNCKKTYNAKRASSKFCSVNCRVLYHQKHGKAKIKTADLQEMFNAVLTAVNSINAKNGQPPASVTAFIPEKPKDSVLSYNELRALIEAATSSMELHKAWKEVEKNKELVGWQIKILNQLKENQRTKIDF
jgi:hypothetical protein